MGGQAGGLTARLLKIAWASPCSAAGLIVALPLIAMGARARAEGGVVEIAFRPTPGHCGRVARKLHYRAITLGHVILAVTDAELASLRAHERVHVAQYERWGLLFFAAYPLASLWQSLAGRDPYWDNPFEIEARKVAGG